MGSRDSAWLIMNASVSQYFSIQISGLDGDDDETTNTCISTETNTNTEALVQKEDGSIEESKGTYITPISVNPARFWNEYLSYIRNSDDF